MDIQRKIELAEQSLRIIARHDDADMALRDAALKRLEGFIEAERAAMAERVAVKVAEQVGASHG